MSGQRDLPSTWLECSLGDVITYGRTAKAEPAEIPKNAWVLELEDIERDSSRVLHRVTFAERRSKSTKNRFEPGDVLYGKLRPYLNKVVRTTEAGYCTTEIVPLTPPAGIDSGYLFYWLKHPRFSQYVTSVSHGLNMPRLGTDAAKGAPFVLAPYPEQQRIVDKLDALLARVDACRERLDRVPGILKRFRQSVLAAATSGELTREWREDRGIDRPWDQLTIEEIIESKPRNGYSPKAVEHPTSVKSLTLTATTTGRFRKEHFKFIDEQIPEDSHLWLKPGDVLIQRANSLEYVGVSAIFDGPPHTFIYPDLMMKCRANRRVHTSFLHLVLSGQTVRTYFREHASGTAGNMPKINQGTVLSAPALVPSIEEQGEIVRQTAELMSMADVLEDAHKRAFSKIEKLAPSALANAFRGELVPQDPNDEPASELLARLRAGRSGNNATEVPKRSGTSDGSTKGTGRSKKPTAKLARSRS